MILGSRMPRIYTPELRPLTPETSLGFEAIAMWKDILGLELLPHQEEDLIRSLELMPGSTTADEFPRLRFRYVLKLMARQNGKTYGTTARALWRMLMWQAPGEKPPPPEILGLAHKLTPAEDILDRAIRTLRACDATRGRIQQVCNTNGNKFVRLDNGSKWSTAAATDDAGRSQSITDVFFDELRQQRNYDAWSAVQNTTNSIYSSQVIAVSNAGEAKSTVLRGLRNDAIREANSLRAWIDEHGTADGWDGDKTICILEWSAPEGADVRDLRALAQANPAMNRTCNGRTFVTSDDLLSQASRIGKTANDGMPEHKFRTEVMCQWVTVSAEPTFPTEQVEKCTDPTSRIADDSPLVYAVDVSKDRTASWVAVAGYREDKKIHVEVITKRIGTHWIAEYLGTLKDPGPIVVQGRGAPASSLITWLEKEGFDIRTCEGTELTNSLSQLDDAMAAGEVSFRPQPALLSAMKHTQRRKLGEVALLDRQNSSVDAAPLCAVTLARWGLANLDLEPKQSAYADGYGAWWEEEPKADNAPAVDSETVAKDTANSDAADSTDDDKEWRWWA
ncbi:hypothetical protein [Devriesea agamarum]|uniref:hypothetical protein n=1 Tax=Devriesea agamarum TaxID=472569 RepID=UPI00071D8DC7|nr:hypothetical protein [Devriesea agamarum]